MRTLFVIMGICAVFLLSVVFAPNASAEENQIGHENGLLNPLVQGEWYTAITSVYTITLGPLFHVIVFLLGPTLTGIKYQRFAPIAMGVLISGVVFAMFFSADLQFLFFIAAMLGIGGIFYSVVHK